MAVDPWRGQHLDADVDIVVGAQADLNAVFDVEQALVDRREEHGAVVERTAALPRVAVRVELQQRHRPVLLRVGLDQRIGDEVIAAKSQHRRVGCQNFTGMSGNIIGHGHRGVGVNGAVAIVHHGQRVEGIKAKGKRVQLGELGRGRPHRARAKPAPGAVGDRTVKGNAGDGDIDALQIAAVAPPGVGQRPGISQLISRALELVLTPGLIDDFGCSGGGVGHAVPPRKNAETSSAYLILGCVSMRSNRRSQR